MKSKSITVHYTERAGAAGLKIRVEVDIAEKLGLRPGQSITKVMRDRILAERRAQRKSQ